MLLLTLLPEMVLLLEEWRVMPQLLMLLTLLPLMNRLWYRKSRFLKQSLMLLTLLPLMLLLLEDRREMP